MDGRFSDVEVDEYDDESSGISWEKKTVLKQTGKVKTPRQEQHVSRLF